MFSKRSSLVNCGTGGGGIGKLISASVVAKTGGGGGGMLFSASTIAITGGDGGAGGTGGDGSAISNNGTASIALFAGFGGNETVCALTEPISKKIATEVINCFI